MIIQKILRQGSSLLLAVPLLVALLSAPSARLWPAWACRPAPNSAIFKSDHENVAAFNTIVIGQITSRRRTGSKITGKIKVIKAYKGTNAKILRYRTATHSCGFSGKTGTIALFFANRTKDGAIQLSALSPIRIFKTEGAALGYARKVFATP